MNSGWLMIAGGVLLIMTIGLIYWAIDCGGDWELFWEGVAVALAIVAMVAGVVGGIVLIIWGIDRL